MIVPEGYSLARDDQTFLIFGLLLLLQNIKRREDCTQLGKEQAPIVWVKLQLAESFSSHKETDPL